MRSIRTTLRPGRANWMCWMNGKPRNTLPGLLTAYCLGGDEEARTPDLCVANAALYQLSYIPQASPRNWSFRLAFRTVG